MSHEFHEIKSSAGIIFSEVLIQIERIYQDLNLGCYLLINSSPGEHIAGSIN